MAIKVSQAFERTSANPIDASLTLTKAQMTSVNDNLMPAYYFTVCQDDGYFYLYDKTATASPTTGKFTKFEGGGGGTGGSEVFSTTATLDADINDTTTVVAADLPGVSFSDITVGVTLIRDAKGTMGLVTAKNGTTDVTVTTATTSTPTKELTQAQYDNLSTAEKNNGTIYFITDNFPGGTYVGAYDTIYSTTEQVVGSYMGKPLYQKTLELSGFSNGNNSFNHNISNFETLVGMKGIISRTDDAFQHYPHEDDSVASYVVDNAVSATTVNIWFGSAARAALVSKIYLTIQYTKTTDTTSPVEYAAPNDYSTSEKIVGSWIDGKPLYQRTVEFSTGQTINASSWWTSNISATNIETPVEAMAHCRANADASLWYSYSTPLGVSNSSGTSHMSNLEFYNLRANQGIVVYAITVKYTKTTD